MAKDKRDDMFRLTIRMKNEVVEWYKNKAESYSVPYTNYMAMLLTNIYEQEQAKELAKQFNETMLKVSNMSDGSMSSEEMVKSMQKILEIADKP